MELCADHQCTVPVSCWYLPGISDHIKKFINMDNDDKFYLKSKW